MNKWLISGLLFVLSHAVIAQQENTTGNIGGIGGTGTNEDITGGIGGTGIRDMERPEMLERPALLDSREALDNLRGADAADIMDESPILDLPDLETPEATP
jgi:hypothetical protein